MNSTLTEICLGMFEAGIELGKKIGQDTEHLHITESSSLTKTLRKLGWFGDTWTPQEYKTQIRNLSDKTLLLWYNDTDFAIPNTPLDFQKKLVKLEVERRGLDK